MNDLRSRNARRAGVTVNYLGLILTAVLFCVGEYGEWSPSLVTATVLATAVTLTTFVLVYVRTGLWQLTHKSIDDLDEREIQLTHQALRYSYAAFTAISMAIIVLMAFSIRFSILTLTHRGHYSLGLVLLVVLNYLILVLPASIIAWEERRV